MNDDPLFDGDREKLKLLRSIDQSLKSIAHDASVGRKCAALIAGILLGWTVVWLLAYIVSQG